MRIARPTRHQRCACEAVAIVRAQPIPWDRYRQIKRKFCTIVGGVVGPPCGAPAGVGFHVPSSTVPAFSQRRIVVVNTGSRANSGS
jgi:hypothetical protein